MNMKKVAIERCASYNSDELYNSIKKAAGAAGFPDVKCKTVLLKLNIVFDGAPEKAITTHPAFLEAVIRLVRELGASRILVGDSPGLQGPNFRARASGLGDAAVKNGAEWVDFTANKIELPCPEGKVQRRFTVTRIVNEVDIIINLPKLKTHQFMLYTGALKNIFGLIPSAAKSPFHVKYSAREAFASMIVDLNLALQAIKPVYALMDAVTGMEGPGPGSGTPRQVGLVLASANFLAMDYAACTIIGYPPEKIPTNKDALERQLWLKDFSEIEYPLLKPDDVKVKDYIKIPFIKTGKIFRKKLPLPKVNKEVCVLCGDCTRICASEAIKITETTVAATRVAPTGVVAANGKNSRQVEVNAKACICCYCCHEICPAKAIEI